MIVAGISWYCYLLLFFLAEFFCSYVIESSCLWLDQSDSEAFNYGGHPDRMNGEGLSMAIPDNPPILFVDCVEVVYTTNVKIIKIGKCGEHTALGTCRWIIVIV